MRLLVIGASGFVGQEVYRLALSKGLNVKGTTTAGTCEYLPFRLDMDTSFDLLKASGFIGYDDIGVVVAGAITNIQKCFQDSALSYAVNVKGTIRLIESFSRIGVKVLFLSSDMVFDGKRGNYKESDLTNPLCVYGKQKREVEEYLLKYCPDVLIYRLTKQVSADLRKGNLFAELYGQYKSKMKIRCIEGLRFNPTDVRDTAECIIQGIESSLHGLYHVASPMPYNRYELTKTFFRLMGVSPQIEIYDVLQFHFLEPRALNTSLSTQRFQNVVSYKFRSIETTMEQFISSQLIAGRSLLDE